LLESGVGYLEVELRDGSLIKVTPLNSEFGEALNLMTPKVSGTLVSWDEETIRLWKVGVSFRAAKKADVYYDIPVEDARKISYTKSGKKFSANKTLKTVVAVPGILMLSYYLIFVAVQMAAPKS